jgi:hypothetical protein
MSLAATIHYRHRTFVLLEGYAIAGQRIAPLTQAFSSA